MSTLSPAVFRGTTLRTTPPPLHSALHIAQLQEQIRARQSPPREVGGLPLDPIFESLLPSGGLKRGAAYTVTGSVSLALALLAAPSAAGVWCGVIGIPNLGVEAAAGLGMDLDRLVLIPDPGTQWLSVTAAALDVLTMVLTIPNRRLSDSETARLNARLRGRGATLIVLGQWPQSEAAVHLSDSTWQGLGNGSGYLTGRQATITVTGRNGTRSRRVWLAQHGPSPALHPAGMPGALFPVADPALEASTVRSSRSVAG